MSELAATTATRRVVGLHSVTTRQRIALIFSPSNAPKPGKAKELIHDHELRHQPAQFEARAVGQCQWRCEEIGLASCRLRNSNTGRASRSRPSARIAPGELAAADSGLLNTHCVCASKSIAKTTKASACTQLWSDSRTALER